MLQNALSVDLLNTTARIWGYVVMWTSVAVPQQLVMPLHRGKGAQNMRDKPHQHTTVSILQFPIPPLV